MKVTETDLKGCFVVEPKFIKDNRGSFLLNFNKNEFNEKTGLNIEFVLENESVSQYGVIRGLHLQNGEYGQAKLVRVTRGKILDIVVDVRPNSNTFAKSFSIELSEGINKQLFVPRGFLYGFAVLEDNTTVNYKCDNYYNFESENGVMFNDPELNIDWKIKEEDIILSEKDRKLIFFSEFKTNKKIE